jgi:hypothetical protein
MNAADKLRLIAQEYLQLAKNASDPAVRSKLIDQASIYAQLGEQASRLKGLRLPHGAGEERERA